MFQRKFWKHLFNQLQKLTLPPSLALKATPIPHWLLLAEAAMMPPQRLPCLKKEAKQLGSNEYNSVLCKLHKLLNPEKTEERGKRLCVERLA